jgi:mannose-6-phosphate isomerase-like protein (cupin superfamily)
MRFKNFKLTNIRSKDNSYSIFPIELKDFIDFGVKRIYFLTDFDTENTKQHCHLEEKELFVMIKGKATAVIDQGNGKEEFELEGGKNAIYCSNFVWHGFRNISKDAIILALSSTNYSPNRKDYLENYEEYLKLRHKGFSR